MVGLMLFRSQPFRKGGLSNQSEGVNHELQFLRRSDTGRQHVLPRVRCATGCFCVQRLRSASSNHAAAQPRHPNLPRSATQFRSCFGPGPTNAAGQQHATNGSNSTRNAPRHGARSAAAAKPPAGDVSSATRPGWISTQSIPTSTTAGQRDAHGQSSRRQRHAESSTRSIARQRSDAEFGQREPSCPGRYQNCPQPCKFTDRCHGQSAG